MAEPVGYKSLFVRNSLVRNDNNLRTEWAKDTPDMSFSRRFGIARLQERNENLIKVLTDPQGALTKVQREIGDVASKKATRYGELLYEFKNQGFSEEEAVARADVLIGRELETDLALMQIKNPYTLGGAEAGGWDPVTAILRANPIAQAAPATFAAISSSGGLGVGKKGGIEKSEKMRLKKKFKRRFKRKRAAKKE
jgi:hypothetical protein